jgi:hypothetical protein
MNLKYAKILILIKIIIIKVVVVAIRKKLLPIVYVHAL